MHIWPHGLMGQVMAVLLGAIVLEFLGSALLYQYFDASASHEESARNFAEQVVVADRVLSGASPRERSVLVSQLSSDHVRIDWRAVPVVDQTGHNGDLRDVRRIMVNWEDYLARRDIRLALDRKDSDLLAGSLALDDGSYIHFSGHLRSHWESLYLSVLSISILILGVLAAAALLIRGLGAPLRHLARAADAVGHGVPVMLTERGPPDLQALARAFNAMQLRIGNLLDSRTRALAAVSHDLRTPLSRLQLRSEQIDNDLVRAAIGKDLSEMELMLDSVLSYLAGESNAEPTTLTDLASLTMTVVDDAQDAGKPVEYDGPDSLHATISPLRVKRALDNLLENAFHYGGRAWVTLCGDEDGVHLTVEDDGPGIPSDQLSVVLEPFRRLDFARPRNTAGLGLGLSIVNHTMQQEGGELRLANREPHGLKAEMFFPQDTMK
ncbi:MAG TPA: ATP-binding protein [Novosphingobium sp.]|nr:ATP-binding protein [Novosphingobium sp.]